MSNTHGHLPKAERAQLPAELRQRLEGPCTCTLRINIAGPPVDRHRGKKV